MLVRAGGSRNTVMSSEPSATRGAAGDTGRVAALLWSNAPRYLGNGRTTTVADWLEPFAVDEIEAHPALALTKAWWCLTAADTEAIEHWTSVAERGLADEVLPDGTPLRSAILLLRAVIGSRGVTGVRDDAALAFDLDRPGSSWRPSRVSSRARRFACAVSESRPGRVWKKGSVWRRSSCLRSRHSASASSRCSRSTTAIGRGPMCSWKMHGG